ncbi:phosphoribosylformimino-5-aminoimidazole carboxamide ribotide isomerase [Gracilibacillus caseinilyticus]|uniref:Phosphoribosylformimino-5-aminoimidazole carboxamide ribotide isomerase n=1 Tax=Gracilibacillus caseinilyticus TaxID=2932256 RepID=A0ABY4EY32_9BACI|nr:phosphoribosylformimino-5-aminoimidazole carboxamide ribotide isomerase [Gracilibacillus caseinilyticus]UOQ48539.1 phosphoribosylformimino-5-aminoimidazole carboxamide ribotide isomerase [Gracilibacillus caseinilyticus]
MEFRPCIDLHQGKVKQIVGATLNQEKEQVIENYVSTYNSSYYAAKFRDDQLTGGHVIMLGGGNKEAAIEALQAYPDGLQIGGGITADNALTFLNAGASHVIVTSYIFQDGELKMDRLRHLVDKIGKERLVIDLSCKKKDGKWFVVTDKWTKFSNIEITASTIKELEQYCDEFLIHAADVEGKRAGIAENLVSILADYVTIPTTYAGGVRSLEDLKLFEQLSKGRLHVTIGSSLDIFGGDLSYDRVVEYCKE